MIALLFCCGISVVAQNNASGKEQLTHAMEYFSSGKYHEALLLFQKLDKKYDLNPRFHAYMGVCYYYDWEYKKACEYLDEAIPKLDAMRPTSVAFTTTQLPRVTLTWSNMPRRYPTTSVS
jgi:tetratricopeptide (TPR) repeat protein